jgi:hypothetical protein
LNFSYELIEYQIVEALPEIKSTSDAYAELEGKPGEDSEAYIASLSVRVKSFV